MGTWEIARSTLCLITAVLMLALSACAIRSNQKPLSPLIEKSPLVDQIYVSSSGDSISVDTLIERMKEADVIYLGEQHDNARHHELQLLLLQRLVEEGLKPSIGFEVFPVSFSSTLLNYPNVKHAPHLKATNFDASKWLREELKWASDDNKNWSYYGRLVEYGAEKQLDLFGIDLQKNIRHRITKLGAKGLTPLERRLLFPTDFKNDNYAELMKLQFKQAHCGWGESAYLNRLLDNWYARNDTMAMAIVEMAKYNNDGPVIVIVGTGHTQYGMGVYERVRHLYPELKQFNLAFRSVSSDITDAKIFLQPFQFKDVDYGVEFEYLWFTPGVVGREDHCKSFLHDKKKIQASSQAKTE